MAAATKKKGEVGVVVRSVVSVKVADGLRRKGADWLAKR
jgi:hypothetical protein